MFNVALAHCESSAKACRVPECGIRANSLTETSSSTAAE
jgi:hypothetical protein